MVKCMVRVARLWSRKSSEGCEFKAGVLSENLKTLCQPNSKWAPVSNQRRIRQQKERDGLRLSLADSKGQCHKT